MNRGNHPNGPQHPPKSEKHPEESADAWILDLAHNGSTVVDSIISELTTCVVGTTKDNFWNLAALYRNSTNSSESAEEDAVEAKL